MKEVVRLDKLAHPLIKLLSFQALVKAAATLGMEKRFFYPLLGVEKSTAVPVFHAVAQAFSRKANFQLRECINQKDYFYSKKLQKVCQIALDLTFAKLKKKHLLEHAELDPNLIEAFYQALEEDYRQQDPLGYSDWNEVLDAFAYGYKSIYKTVAKTLHLNSASPEGKLLKSFINRFPKEMHLAFLDQLFQPKHKLAKLDFLFYLLVTYAYSDRNQNVVLREFIPLLKKVEGLPAIGKHRRHKIRDLIESVEQLLARKQADVVPATPNTPVTTLPVSSPLPLYLPGDASSQPLDLKGEQAFTTFYQELTIPFVNRKVKLRGLHKLVELADRAFQWDGLLGPPGIGKKRLVTEFCRQIRKQGYTAGFLRVEHLRLLWDYQPEQHTLVVIDGIATNFESVIQLIEHLYERRNTHPLAKNLRLLFLDRSRYDCWWEYLKNNSAASRSHFQGISRGTDWPIFGLRAPELWYIIQRVYQQKKKEDIPYSSGEVLKELHRIDPDKRPQFAILVGSMLADGHYNSLSQWDKTHLLAYFLDQKKNGLGPILKTYRQAAIYHQEALLVLTTITQGLPEDIIQDLGKEQTNHLKWLPAEPDRDLYLHLASVRIDKVSGMLIWEGLPTNMVGEFYVLHQFEYWLNETEDHQAAKETIEKLIQTAWQLKPAETRAFIHKVVQDFPDWKSRRAYELLLYTGPLGTASKQVWKERARLFNYLMQVIYEETELATFARYYEELKKEINAIADNKTKEFLLLYQAKISNNLHHYYVFYEDEGQAEKYNQQVATLLDEFKTKDLAYWQAQVHSNYIKYFLKKNQPQRAEDYYGLIDALKETFASSDIAWLQATAALDIINYFVSAGPYEIAQQYYHQLEVLHTKFPDVNTALVLAKAVERLAIECMHMKMEEQANHYLSQLTNLNSKFHNFELVIEEVTLIHRFMCYYHGNEGDEENNSRIITKYLERIAELDRLQETF